MNKISLRNSINLYCKNCIYDRSVNGSWRKQVQNCTASECHLFLARPIPKGNAGGRQLLRNLINRECKSCIYDPKSNGTWRKQVEECTSVKCPLYTVRPVSKLRSEKGQKTIKVSLKVASSGVSRDRSRKSILGLKNWQENNFLAILEPDKN